MSGEDHHYMMTQTHLDFLIAKYTNYQRYFQHSPKKCVCPGTCLGNHLPLFALSANTITPKMPQIPPANDKNPVL